MTERAIDKHFGFWLMLFGCGIGVYVGRHAQLLSWGQIARMLLWPVTLGWFFAEWLAKRL